MTILKLGSKGPEVTRLQEILTKQGYYKGNINGTFGEITRESVFWFQATHLGSNGIFLDSDCEVGDSTWWALNNPSKDPQSSKIDPIIPGGLSTERVAVLEFAVKERKKGVKEAPDGSNWGPEIKKYGGREGWAWCSLFVNWCMKQGLGKYPIGRIEPSCFRMWKESDKRGIFQYKEKYSPIPGDAFIMQYKDSRGNLTGKGHTGLILRVSENGKLFNAIEGNTANRVKDTLREIGSSKIIGYVVPYTERVASFERGVLYGNVDPEELSSTR